MDQEPFRLEDWMRRIVLGVLLLTAGAPLGPALDRSAADGQTARREPWLVSTAWLQEHQADGGLVVIQVATMRREYRQGHVPGARFLWAQAYAPSTPDGTYDLPTLEQATVLFRELGLTADSRIVLVYSGAAVQQAARALLTFEQFGFGGRVSIMNGGIDAWKAEGRPVSTETPPVAPGTAVARDGGQLVVDATYVQARLDAPGVTIVDARDARFYDGNGGGQPRPGHIPNAVNVPYGSLIEGTRIKDEAALRQIFAAAGVKTGSEVVSYCHIGQQASLVWLVARMLGHEARLYDGSFEDWSGRDDLPVVNPAAKLP
jgi:thiosulfate/3-mercaptopyruvate sulfurtransferase